MVNGTASIDTCGVCAGGNTGLIPGSSCLDCNGDIFGTASIDSCGVCTGGNTGIVANASCTDCNGVLLGTAQIDSCGVCAGGNTGITPGSSCLNCTANEVVSLTLAQAGPGGVAIRKLVNGDTIYRNLAGPFSVVADICEDGVVGSVLFYLDGVKIRNENKKPYAINGDKPTGYRSWNVSNGTYLLNATPYSGGNGKGSQGIGISILLTIADSAVNTDCNGQINGLAFVDKCGVCAGGNTGITPNASCRDCNGVINGLAFIDNCRICAGGNTGVTPNSSCADCNGDPNGLAFIDNCEVCAGGNTGVSPNTSCADCNGDPNGLAFIDNCGVCAGGNTGVSPNTSCADCNGDPNGLAFIDSCGICVGGNTGVTPNASCVDCNGDPNGLAFIDSCGICVGGNTGVTPNASCVDCNGDPNGQAFIDNCGVCAGGNTGVTPNTSCADCNGDPNGLAFIDSCGMCVGGNTGIIPNSSCVDCNGDPNGLAFIDNCGICAGGNSGVSPNTSCADCNGDPNGLAYIDSCGVCAGGNTGVAPNASCADCNGDPNGLAFIDNCGVCVGGNTGVAPNASCADCNGVPNGLAFIDNCGVCAGGNTGVAPNASCADCNGDPNGLAFIDNCGVCAGGNTGVAPNASCADCNGDPNGLAFIDSCGVCAGGNTGVAPNASCADCNGDPNGLAFIDNCGVCAGGNTGVAPNASCADCNGVPNGQAFIDTCGVCAGGNTGVIPNQSCPGCMTDEVVSFTLMQAGSGGMAIRKLVNGDVIYLSNIGSFSIRADICNNGIVGSVAFNLNGNMVQMENSAPYSISGDNNGAFYPWNVGPGSYSLTAIPFSGIGGSGNPGIAESVSFQIFSDPPVVDCNGDPGGTAYIDACGICAGGNTGITPNSACLDCFGVVNGTASVDSCGVCSGGATGIVPNSTCVTECTPNEVIDMVLVDALTNTDIASMSNGDTIDLGVLPLFSIRAMVCSDLDVNSVEFVLGANSIRTENVAPYTVNGDNNGIYNPWILAPGYYTLTSIPYSGINASGNMGVPMSVSFWVVGSSSVGNSVYIDCNGDFNGSAYIDGCGDCVGGNTGNKPCNPQSACGEYIEMDGLLVAEIESEFTNHGNWYTVTGPISGINITHASGSFRMWNANCAKTAIPGFDYSGCTGINMPYDDGVLTYDVLISEPGRYRFQMRSWQPELVITDVQAYEQHNDFWLNVPNGVGVRKGGNRESHIGGDEWVKVYQNSPNQWVWETKTDLNGIACDIYLDFPKAGAYSLSIAGRSDLMSLDRFVLYRSDNEENNVSEVEATINMPPESPRLNCGGARQVGTSSQSIDNNQVATAYDKGGDTGKRKLEADEIRVNLFPNPTTGMVNLTIVSANGEALIEVYDAKGKLLIQKTQEGELNIINLSSYSKGFYWIKINVDGKLRVFKVLKQ
jgi:hypothetical protein